MSSTYVLMLERGDDGTLEANEKIVNPGLESLRKLSTQLDVPFEWLAFGTGGEPPWSTKPDSSPTEAA
jgi:hypothetical protein